MLYYSNLFLPEKCVCWLQAGQTPLLLAVKKNNVAMVRELARVRVDVNHMEQVSSYLQRPLLWYMLVSREDSLL